MGPSSGLAAVAASAVVAAGITDEIDVASFVAGMTLASGLLFLVLAVLRMGWIAQFLSRAVVTGFLFGAAIDVVIGELPKITGTDVSGSNSFQELRSWLGSLADTDQATLVVGAVALVVVFGLRVVAPRVPGALVLVVRRAAGVVRVRPRRPRRRPGRGRAARPAVVRDPGPRADVGPRASRSRSARSR